MNCKFIDQGCAKGNTCGVDFTECGLAGYFEFLDKFTQPHRVIGGNLLPVADLDAMMKMRTVVDPRCIGCSKAINDTYCSIFVNPTKRWPDGEVTVENKCLHADHVVAASKKVTQKINPIKASKRAKKGR